MMDDVSVDVVRAEAQRKLGVALEELMAAAVVLQATRLQVEAVLGDACGLRLGVEDVGWRDEVRLVLRGVALVDGVLVLKEVCDG